MPVRGPQRVVASLLGEMLLLGTYLGLAPSACILWDVAGAEGGLGGWHFGVLVFGGAFFEILLIY